MITTANFKRKKDGSTAGLPIRGFEPQAFFVRPEIKIVDGPRCSSRACAR